MNRTLFNQFIKLINTLNNSNSKKNLDSLFQIDPPFIQTLSVSIFFSCEWINGTLGAKKYPVKLAIKMGTK